MRFSSEGVFHNVVTIEWFVEASGGIITTVGWDHGPVRLLVRDDGPKLQLVCYSPQLA